MFILILIACLALSEKGASEGFVIMLALAGCFALVYLTHDRF
jgi:hypothetical protein